MSDKELKKYLKQYLQQETELEKLSDTNYVLKLCGNRN